MATGLRRKRIYFFPYFFPCLTLSRLLSPWCHWCTSHPPSIPIAFYPSYLFLLLFSCSFSYIFLLFLLVFMFISLCTFMLSLDFVIFSHFFQSLTSFAHPIFCSLFPFPSILLFSASILFYPLVPHLYLLSFHFLSLSFLIYPSITLEENNKKKTRERK